MHFLKNYTIQEELGGQKIRKFGRTILIEDKRSKLLRVVKIIDKNSKKSVSPELLQQESTFNFKHPSLPQVIEHRETNENAFLILDYKPGITIDAHWEKLNRKERHPFLLKFLAKISSIFDILKEYEI